MKISTSVYLTQVKSYLRFKAKMKGLLKVFFLVIFSVFVNHSFGLNFNYSNDYHFLDDNTNDGRARFYIDRYDDGNKIVHFLFIQAKVNGTWTDIGLIHHFTQTGGTEHNNRYYAYGVNGYSVSFTNFTTGTIDTDGDGDKSEYVYRATINSSPTGIYNSPVEFRLREVDFAGTDNDGDFNWRTGTVGSFKDFPSFYLTFYKPKAPTGLTASTNVCNQVNLTWNQPSNFRSNSSNTYGIYRNNGLIAYSNTTSYTDSNVADGVSYSYKVALYNGSQWGETSSEANGNSIPPPEAPSNLSASNDRCDGTVYVQWQWLSSTPDNFQLQRSTSQNSGYIDISNTLPGGINYYEDTPPLKNTTYYYRVRAKNNCGDWGTYTTGVSGYAPDAPAAPGNIAHSFLGTTIKVTWTDSSFNEDKFVVTRTNQNTGVTNNYDINANVEFFEDDNAQLCIPYEYEVKAVSNCGNSEGISTGNVILSPDLSNTFPANSFKASKGYFADIVHLEWDNKNRNQINSYYIYRKVFRSSDSTLLSTLDGAQASYDDNYAENGILYEYSIIAEGFCDTLSVWSNVANDIGFRNPAATVSGKITYGSGEPVKGVTVTAESDEVLETTSLQLNGTNSYLSIPNNTSNNIQNSFTFQTYLRLSQIKASAIFNKGGQYKLNYTGSAFEFSVGSNTLTLAHQMPLDTFVHVSVVFDGSMSSIYIDGKLMASKTGVAASTNNTSPFVIGKEASANFLNGFIDEIRIWNTALDSTTIKRDYNRYISFRTNGLIGYYRLNENIAINTFYDISKSETDYNENHGTRFNTSYSTTVPLVQQLWFKGLTDINGDYLITGIPYFTDGSSYNIVPLLAPHQFNPNGKRLFMSDEAQVHNNIDFIDISSFKVNGSIVYRNTTLGVKGVNVFVDGDPVIGPDLKPEKTDEQGRFEILVPIGNHYISFQKDGHSFDNGGRYPYDSNHPDSIVTYNFIKNETFGIPFVDTTLVTVIGRVIGGTSSNTIPMGFEQASNNIGKATITIDHSSSSDLTFDNLNGSLGNDTIQYSVLTEINGTTGDSTITDVQYISNRTFDKIKIFTSGNSGEFVAKLIPEKFSIVDINVDNDSQKKVNAFFGNRVIDLSVNTPQKFEKLKDENGVVLDSVPYHFKLNYIYQTQPEISVTNINDTQVFYGEKEIVYTNPTSGLQDTINVPTHFKYPIFKMMNNYSPKISIFESYENYDMPGNPARFTNQSIKEAEIKIINDLAVKDQVKIYQLKPEMNGVIVDTFKVGIPNITKSEFDKTSFTKTLQIYVNVDGNSFPWLVDGKLYRAYIIGQRPKGNNFYTEGPEIPEIILRDPPGSRSSAYIEKGSSYSVSSSYSTDFENGSGFGAEILLGVEVAAGGGLAGPVIKTDTKNSGKTGLNFSTSINTSGEYVKSYEFSERVETSSDPGMVGSMADIYIGKSYNYFYGETDHLKIVPYNLAKSNGIIALDSTELENKQYTLGIVEGFLMNPDNSDTYFKYTQAHVLNKLLPELESRRNTLFLTSKRSDGVLKYKTEINDTDLRYGVAHSYEIETTASDTIVKAYFKMSETDSILTYSFRPEQKTIADLNNILNDTIYEIDSIRYYNSQIGIWVDAIRLNETEKAMAISSNTLEQNISFDGGVGSISRSELQTISYNKEESRTKNMHFGAQGSVGFTFNKAGVIATGELSISHSLGVSSGESFSQTMEYGYTLEDGDAGDYYSINVMRRPESGIYNANDLQETKMSMPSGFDFGSLGTGVALVGGGIAVAAAASYNAGGGIPIVAGAAVMAVAAGLSYIPYVSFMDDVKNEGERFQPGDIRVSSFDISSPIFSTLGGQTMCPFQGLEHTFFYRDNQGDSIVLHKPTLQREKPEITAEPAKVPNVPITDKAFFTIRLANNTESGDDQWYTVSVDEKTNPYGAAVKIDGASANKTILVPANTTVTKSLTISPTNKSIMEYDSIGIVIHSTCQYDPTDFIPDISDTVFISASFQPACTNVEILEPLDNWVVNVNDRDTMTIRLGGYNLGHDSFQGFRFEYKPSSGSIWIPVKYFVTDPLLANKDQVQDTLLISKQTSVSFQWDMISLKDRNYDIRAVSNCSDGSENESTILSGILDGQRPQIFGTPQPADGILNVDENISVQFNEPIEGGLLTEFNFDVKGTLNNYQLEHEAYIRMNGATDYAAIPEGISFNDKSFTIEFWMRVDDFSDAVILSQGNDPASNLEIGLKNNQTYFKIGNVEYSAPLKFDAIPADEWHHMAYVYDYENGDIFIYQNDVIIFEVRSVSVNFNNMGKIYLGKSSVNGSDYFAGSFHELRIWSKSIDIGEIYSNQYTALSGNEVGLYGYWPIDEAFGDLAIDKSASRHMVIFAPWEAYPGGYSWDFAGNNYLSFFTGYFTVIPEMDYTIEFWFKDDNPISTVTLFSNQKGDGNESPDLLKKTLSISATPNGKIWVNSKGHSFEAVSTDYFDNTWHHFALVVRRMGNVIAYIDGEPQSEKENSQLGGIAGGNMVLGARKWDNISGSGLDQFYTGKLDEFRLWNLAKTNTQIRMDMNSKLNGDEIGLQVYFPFEGYYTDFSGLVQQNKTLENFDDDINSSDAIPQTADKYSTDAPNMKNVRPVQSIAYDWVSSDDKIIINPKTYLFSQLEKNIIEITVEGVEDKFANRMASPVTWTAYVHRNQVRWEDERRLFTKELYKPFSFTSSIKNTGGQQIGFSIANLAPWLTAYPSSGVINPESTLDIEFHINPALNIGEYNEDIILRTENGFDEKLPITVRVYKPAPEWNVEPSKFASTMNMVGKVKIEGVLSTDIFDKVAVFVNDSIRGVANVRYVKNFDSYLVFLNVYGNVNGEKLDFRIWDASVGQILDNVSPFNLTFVPDGYSGTTLNPVIFEATGVYRQYIPLAKGWNWVSFNKWSSNQDNLNSFFSSLEPQQNDQIKTHGAGYNNYDLSTGWIVGGIDSIDNRQMYQIKLSGKDTLVYSGEDVVPEDNPIHVKAGWNHVGYLPDLSMDVNDALRLYVADTSEIIKSQFAFSMYDPRAGWLGTLDVMKPGLGYMINVKKDGVLKYPNSTIFKGAKIVYAASTPNGWNSDLSEYAGNLSIVAKINIDPASQINVNSEMVLGAFINGECHGFVSPLSNSEIGYEPFFLNVSNNTHGQTITFKLFDGLTGLTYDINEVRQFAQNAVYGTTQNPLELSLKGLSTNIGDRMNEKNLRVYPNPFNEQINIEFNGTSGKVRIDVVNATGAVIQQIFEGYPIEGTNKLIWNGRNQNGTQVSSGLYYVRFTTDHSMETIKISKSR